MTASQIAAQIQTLRAGITREEEALQRAIEAASDAAAAWTRAREAALMDPQVVPAEQDARAVYTAANAHEKEIRERIAAGRAASERLYLDLQHPQLEERTAGLRRVREHLDPEFHALVDDFVRVMGRLRARTVAHGALVGRVDDVVAALARQVPGLNRRVVHESERVRDGILATSITKEN